MNAETKKQFETYMAELQAANGGQDPTMSFSVSPSVSQTIAKRVQESSDFLKRINIHQVDNPEGEALRLGVSGGPIARRTSGERETTDASDLDANGYTCKQTNYDTHLTYAKMDAWAKTGHLKENVNSIRFRQIALDRIRTGFNGVRAEANSDLPGNPSLSDLNVGWLQYIRDNAPWMVFSESSLGAGEVRVGMTGDYVNLNALVYDVGRNVLPPWHHDDKGIVCLMSRRTQHYYSFPFMNATNGDGTGAPSASEQLARDALLSAIKLDGRYAYVVPFIPDGTILLTSFDNLSIYDQRGTHRRRIVDNPKRNRVETYESINEAYVVEDISRAVLIENIQPGY